MGEFIIMLRNVLIFVALAIPGYLLVKFGMLKQEQSGVLSKILMFLALPFLIFSGTVNNLSFNKKTLLMIGIVLGIGIIYTLIMFFISKPLTGMEKSEKTKGMMRFCSVFSNNGFLGIPLAVAVFGRDSLVFTVLILLNIISNVLMYTLGAYLVSGDKQSINVKKVVLNPVLIAFVLGLIFNLLNISKYVPEVITFSEHFSSLVTPISMTVLGMKLSTICFSKMFNTAKLYYVSFLKLILFPIVIIMILLMFKNFLLNIEFENLVLGVFFAFAMPTAGLATTFADEFNGDTENAVIYTLGTTILLDGKLIAYNPETSYSQVKALSDNCEIVTIYDNVVVEVIKPVCKIINSSKLGFVIVKNAMNRNYEIINCMGDLLKTGCISSALEQIDIPLASILIIK